MTKKRWYAEDNALYVIGTIYGMLCRLLPTWDTPSNFTKSCMSPLLYLDMFTDIAAAAKKMTARQERYMKTCRDFLAEVNKTKIEHPSPNMQGAYQLGYYAGKSGRYLKFLRLCKGLTQAQLAEKSGITVSAIKKLEGGERDIRKASLDTIERLANAVDCEIEDLLDNMK